MSHSELVADLKLVFHRHGRANVEDQDWSAIVSLQVLTLEAMEALLTTANELQQKVNGLSDKLSGVEADVRDLLAKAGGTAPPAAGGPTISQDQLDSMGATIDTVLSRLDALRTEISAPPAQTTPTPGATPPASTPPVTPPPGAPASPPSGASS